LEHLSLLFTDIVNLSELVHALMPLTSLRTVQLIENDAHNVRATPATMHPLYPHLLLFHCPWLTELDFRTVTDADRMNANRAVLECCELTAFRVPRDMTYGEKRTVESNVMVDVQRPRSMLSLLQSREMGMKISE
jgi:hypothetical protein